MYIPPKSISWSQWRVSQEKWCHVTEPGNFSLRPVNNLPLRPNSPTGWALKQKGHGSKPLVFPDRTFIELLEQSSNSIFNRTNRANQDIFTVKFDYCSVTVRTVNPAIFHTRHTTFTPSKINIFLVKRTLSPCYCLIYLETWKWVILFKIWNQKPPKKLVKGGVKCFMPCVQTRSFELIELIF